jgi:diguanylate cyclase (GGDEF)-like protein/PAS domain S-box-containing protein
MVKFWQSLSVQCSRWILLAILLTSFLLAAVSYLWVLDNAIDEQRNNLIVLLETMQNTARVACFANNAVLAKEVVDGLQRNKLVTGAGVWSRDTLLATSGLYFSANASDEKAADILTQPIFSPFDEKEIIGQIAIHLNTQKIVEEAQHGIVFVGVLLLVQAILLIIVVNVVVLRLVVQPVKRVVTDLAKLLPFDGETITKPKNHQHDELGQLVEEINQLSYRLNATYSEEVMLRTELEQDEKRFRSIFEYAQTGLFVVDNAGHILSRNRCFSEYLGSDDTLDHLFATRLGKNAEQLQRLLANPETSPAYFELINQAGTHYWLELNLNRINNDRLQGILNDVTQLKLQELQHHHLALTDALTDINNRRGFDHYLHCLFNQRQGSHSFVLMLIDLDFFKQVNDVHGHAAGDLVLCHVAQTIKYTVRSSDYVARLGGDEFAVIMENCVQSDIASDIAEAIIARLSIPIAVAENIYVTIGASIGIALCDSHYQTLEQLFDHADKALYSAKEAGRNCLRVATKICY